MPQTIPSPRCRLSASPSVTRPLIALLTVEEARPVAHAIDLIGRQ